MSNNPVSFVDPDGGQDGFSAWLYYAGRPGVFFGAGLAYYEDGIKVEGFEVGYRISHYLRSISHYNSSKREYGYWEITEADDIEYVNVFPDHPECTTCTVASPAVGFEKKWVTVLGANEYKTARQVLYNKNGPAFDVYKPASNAWTSFRKLGPNAEMLYGTLNDAYMVFQGSILLEENMRQLDISEPYVQKGSADHQFAFAATLIPFGRMGGAGKSGVFGGIKSWQGLKAAFKAGKQEMRLAKVATEAVEQVGPLANLKNTSNFAAESGAVGGNPQLLQAFNSVESIIQHAGKLERLKGGVKQGFVRGNADDIFTGLSQQYGAQVQTGASGQRFFQSGNIRVDLTSSSGNIPTLRINNDGKLFKIRVQ